MGDARRIASDYFEWWYFDGLLDDGTVVVVWFGDNWLYGSHKRAVDYRTDARRARPTRRVMRTFDDPGSLRERPSRHRDWASPLRRRICKSYAIHVDASRHRRSWGATSCCKSQGRRPTAPQPATIEAG